MDKRGFPTSLPEFQRAFPDDGACARYLEAMRWPNGFACQHCGLVSEPYRFPTRSSVVLRCRGCKANTSLTAGTVMQSSHTPLSTWFWGAYLMTTQIPGQSAVQFQRQLALTRYETAFQILHKFFFFQAEDGIRDVAVTGVQTCALPICGAAQIER